MAFLSPLPGLGHFPFRTHSLRCGLHSFAAFAAVEIAYCRCAGVQIAYRRCASQIAYPAERLSGPRCTARS